MTSVGGMTLPAQCHIAENASLWLEPAVSLLEGCINSNIEGRVLFPSSFTSLSSIARFSSSQSSSVPTHIIAPDKFIFRWYSCSLAVKCNFEVMHRSASCVLCKLEFKKFCCLVLKIFVYNSRCNFCFQKHRVGLNSSKREIEHCQFVSCLLSGWSEN